MTSKKAASIVTLMSVSTLLFGCSKGSSTQPQQQQTTTAAQTAAAVASAPAAEPAPGAVPASVARLFKSRCAICHGETGHGDGPGAAALKVKPRNYADASWQKSVTDENVKEIILKGGAAVGKDPGMPANPDLESKPEVLEGLVKLVRSFAPQGELADPAKEEAAAKAN